METKNNAIRDARTLGIPKMLLLGLQHMFAMFGATILVPILVNNYFKGEGLSIQVTLFCAGVGTLFFHLCTKLKVPAFLGDYQTSRCETCDAFSSTGCHRSDYYLHRLKFSTIRS